MQKLLRKAVHTCFLNGQVDHDAMHNYFMSGMKIHEISWNFEWLNKEVNIFVVTEREVINGVLNVENTKAHCLAYVRCEFVWMKNIV